jgi:hypothetical protein
MPKAKPYSGPIDIHLAVQLLNSSGESFGEALLGDALSAAAENLATLVERANKFLVTSDFAKIVAEHQATKIGRRGRATIYVSETGHAILAIGYDGEAPVVPQAKPPKKRQVPLLDELRKLAAELGIDISSFGSKRKEIWEHLQAIGEKRGGGKKEKDDAGPMSAGPDEVRVSPPPDEPPPRRKGIVKTADAVSAPVVVEVAAVPPAFDAPRISGDKKNLRQLVQDAETVDISALLGSETPE